MAHSKAWPAAALLSLSCLGAGAAEPPPLQTVEQVDLERYLGHWYEIAKLPNRFQDHCVCDTTAEYKALENERIRVINRCRGREGELDEARGVARVVDRKTNARLEVSFVSILGFHLFWGDYWIIDLGEDYDYAVVGEPDRRYGWILSRTPALDERQRAAIDARLRQVGYLPEDFEQSCQTATETPPSPS